VTVLRSGIRGLLRSDGNGAVTGIWDYLLARHRVLRFIEWVVARTRGTWVPSALMMLYAAVEYARVQAPRSGGVIVAARRPNERRAVADVLRMLPDAAWSPLSYRWRPLPGIAGLWRLARSPWRDWRRIARLGRRIHLRDGAFRAARCVELVLYYRRYLEILRERPCSLAVMSSHTNPHGLAFNLAARRAGVPTVLVTHGIPWRPMARLDFDLAIVENDVCRQMYEEADWRITRVVVMSRCRDFAPMRLSGGRDRLTVGILLSKDPNEGRVMQCLRALAADPRIGSILVRPHPVNLWAGLRRSLEALHDSRIVLVGTRTAL
jgi:hypothetical protein